ncbi:hypothetical protein AB9F46_23695 [Rhizobium leguminosarum]|uniref:hypothetical protein n=1 Tax=Rhizobium leguminosarum TaxID=384 RepID=UPI003F986FED
MTKRMTVRQLDKLAEQVARSFDLKQVEPGFKPMAVGKAATGSRGQKFACVAYRGGKTIERCYELDADECSRLDAELQKRGGFATPFPGRHCGK